ncbi:Hcp family type VI secretion system effector [Microbacterium pumilum]|uniref:Hcp family type VI secretion system effector n=2 Tax=Microbacterium pumilum TaxID=344165 RepID=A0ABN2RVB0_9MICO
MDMFLKIDAIPGDATEKGHEKWIPLLSADGGVSQAVGMAHHGGGAGAGKAEFRPAAFTAWTSVATPLLFAACVSGKHAATATFEALREGDRPVLFMRWDFEDVLVTTVGTVGGGGGPSLADSFALSYNRIRVTTFSQDPKGGLGTATARGWDLVANRAW